MAETTAAAVPAAQNPESGKWSTGILDVGDDLATGKNAYKDRVIVRKGVSCCVS